MSASEVPHGRCHCSLSRTGMAWKQPTAWGPRARYSQRQPSLATPATAQFAVSLAENPLLFCLRRKHWPVGCSVLKGEEGGCQGSGLVRPPHPTSHSHLPKCLWVTSLCGVLRGARQVYSGVSSNCVPLWTLCPRFITGHCDSTCFYLQETQSELSFSIGSLPSLFMV